MAKLLRINDVFVSPQGEGLFTGFPMTFVRLQGCNLRCEFCDTPEALASQGGREVSTEALAAELMDGVSPEIVCFTGGEPLLQLSAVRECSRILRNSGWKIHVETNGTVDLLESHCLDFDWITVSPKGPTWACRVPRNHVSELKFVMPGKAEYIADLDDKVWPDSGMIKLWLQDFPSTTFFWIQPRSNLTDAVSWSLEVVKDLSEPSTSRALRVGLSVQTHKYIGVK